MTRTLGLAALLVLAGPPVAADEGGAIVESGETLFSQGTAISLSFIHQRKGHLLRGSDRLRNDEEMREEENLGVLSVNYGLSPRFTVSLVSPYRELDETSDPAGDRLRLGDSGIGDVGLLGKYRFLFEGGERWEATASVIAGVQFPTGQTDERGPDGERLEPELQLGSGSFDGLLGVAGTYEWDRFEVSASLAWQLNTEGARGFEHGDLLAAGVALAWRPWVEKYPGPELGVKTRFWWAHEGGAEIDGHRVEDSGRDILFASPGVFFSPRTGIQFSASGDLPMYQRVEGEQLGLDVRLSVGVTFTF